MVDSPAVYNYYCNEGKNTTDYCGKKNFEEALRLEGFFPIISESIFTQRHAIGTRKNHLSVLAAVNDAAAYMEEQEPSPAEILSNIALRFAVVDKDELDQARSIIYTPAMPNDVKEVVQAKFNMDITRKKMKCLQSSTWLNDEIINFYMLMLNERDSRITASTQPPRRTSHFFNSFFVTKLLETTNGQYYYPNVKRWTKKINILEKEKLYFPINIGNAHWTLLVVFMQRKEIRYYNSMLGRDGKYMKGIMDWIVEDALDKKRVTVDPKEWVLIDMAGMVPQQTNWSDCGVFTIVCADFLSDNLPLNYQQEHMPNFRLQIGAAILRGSINY